MERRDRRLDDVRAAALQREGPIERLAPAGDLGGVPARTVLVCEQHELAAVEPGLAARVVEQHQRLEAVHLGLVRHQLGERRAEPERLRRQIDAAAVALVEDQVDDREHRRQPLRQQMVGGNAEGDARILDLPLRPREPPLHRLLGNEERAGDLLGAQPAERAQGQRDLRLETERRMAAREDQLQPLVGKRRLLHLVLHGLGHLEQARLLGERAVAAQAVDRAVAGGDRQPGARIGRRAVARPALGGDRERLLSGLLGEVEVAEEADQAGEDAAPLVAEDLLEQRLPLHQRPHLDRAAHPRGRDPRGDLERRIEIVRLDHDEAADVLLRVDERTVGEQRLSVLNAHGRRGLDRLQLLAADDPWQPPSARYSSTIACCSSADSRSNASVALPG